MSFIPIAARFGSALEGTALAEFVGARSACAIDCSATSSSASAVAFDARAHLDHGVQVRPALTPSFHYLSSNLDILVPEGCARIGRRILTDMGYVELLNVEEPRKLLFRRFAGDGSSFAFHLHEVVGWGVPFLDNGPVWSRARHPADDPDILIPGPVGGAAGHARALVLRGQGALARQSVSHRERAAHDGRSAGGAGRACAAARVGRKDSGARCASSMRRGNVCSMNRCCPSRAAWRARSRAGALRRGARACLPLVGYGANNVPARIPFKANKVAYYRKVMRDHARPVERKLVDVIDTLLWAVRWKLHVRSQPALLVTFSGMRRLGQEPAGGATARGVRDLRRARATDLGARRVVEGRGRHHARGEARARRWREAARPCAVPRPTKRSVSKSASVACAIRSRAGYSAWCLPPTWRGRTCCRPAAPC